MKNIISLLTFIACFLTGSMHIVAQHISFTNGSGLQYFQNFNSLSNTTGSSVLPNGWYLAEVGSNSNTTYTVDAGASSAGNTYSYGTSGSTERALGELTSGSLTAHFGALFINNTDSDIVRLDFNFFSEQWRRGAVGTQKDSCVFQYSTSATGLLSGVWNNFHSLNLRSSNFAGTTPVGALDGNQTINSTQITQSLNGISIPVGDSLWIRFVAQNISGSDDALSIDSFYVTAFKGAPIIIPGNVTFAMNDISVNESAGSISIPINYSNANSLPASVEVSVATISNAMEGSNNDFLRLDTTITFPANSNTTQYLNIQINEDAMLESDEYFLLKFNNPVNTTPIGITSQWIYITDNDRLAPDSANDIRLQLVSSFSNGTAGSNSAEIVVHDKSTQRLYIANSVAAKLDIVDFNTPASPVLLNSIDISSYGNINSVAVNDSIVACAIENSTNPQDSGKVIFFDYNGNFIHSVNVGMMPDMIAFNHAGTKIYTCNEGEPNSAYTSDPDGSISVINISSGVLNASVKHIAFTKYNGQESALRTQGIRIYGPGATASKDFEPEYISIASDDQTAKITLQENNALATLDLQNDSVLSITALGFKDHTIITNGMDVSDLTSGKNLSTWPVKGMYLPDAIAQFTQNGLTYFITANEGDSRAYSGFSEETTIASLTLDPTVFPNANDLKSNYAAGKLKASNKTGDIDNDGDIDEIHTLGSRSFSIWDMNGNLVYDSGDDFERITRDHPIWTQLFNSSNGSSISIKNRSDDKGPEPEGISIGYINNVPFAFVALERIGGVMVYNLVNPIHPKFVGYYNNRNSGGGPDRGAEGVVFISSDQSPDGSAYLLLANETSSTLSIFKVKGVNTSTYVLKDSVLIGNAQGINVYEGGFSGLHYIKGTNLEFYVNTDRGPNVDANDITPASGDLIKYFPFPQYSPKVHRIKAQGDSIFLMNSKAILKSNGMNASGIPNPAGSGSTGEIAWLDTLGTIVAPDAYGLDAEGIIQDNNGQFLVCEEYGSSVWAISDSSMKLQNKYSPFGNGMQQIAIDTIIKKRLANRGFEGVAFTPNGLAYAILQSPLANPSVSASNSSRLHRLIEFNPSNGITRMLAYVHDAPIGGSTGIRDRDWKIGDLVAINNHEFLVLEHAERGGYNRKNVYKIDISSASPIINENYNGKTFEQLQTADSAITNGVIPVSKTLYCDLLACGWDVNHDKPEGLTIVNDSTIALVNDNDYGIEAPLLRGKIVPTGKSTKLTVITLPTSIQSPLNLCYPIQITASSATTFCQGGNVVLQGSGMNNGNLSWQNAGNQIAGQTANNYTASSSGNYQMIENTAYPTCVAISNSVNVIVNPLPATPVISQSNDTLFSSTPYQSYQWYLNGNSVSGANDSIYHFTQNGTYYVMVIDSNSCSTTSSSISINSIGIANFAGAGAATVYPNPFRENLHLNFYSQTEGILLAEIYGLDGKLFSSTQHRVGALSQNTFSLLQDNFTAMPGIYFLKLHFNSETKVIKLIAH